MSKCKKRRVDGLNFASPSAKDALENFALSSVVSYDRDFEKASSLQELASILFHANELEIEVAQIYGGVAPDVTFVHVRGAFPNDFKFSPCHQLPLFGTTPSNPEIKRSNANIKDLIKLEYADGEDDLVICVVAFVAEFARNISSLLLYTGYNDTLDLDDLVPVFSNAGYWQRTLERLSLDGYGELYPILDVGTYPTKLKSLKIVQCAGQEFAQGGDINQLVRRLPLLENLHVENPHIIHDGIVLLDRLALTNPRLTTVHVEFLAIDEEDEVEADEVDQFVATLLPLVNLVKVSLRGKLPPWVATKILQILPQTSITDLSCDDTSLDADGVGLLSQYLASMDYKLGQFTFKYRSLDQQSLDSLLDIVTIGCTVPRTRVVAGTEKVNPALSHHINKFNKYRQFIRNQTAAPNSLWSHLLGHASSKAAHGDLSVLWSLVRERPDLVPCQP